MTAWFSRPAERPAAGKDSPLLRHRPRAAGQAAAGPKYVPRVRLFPDRPLAAPALASPGGILPRVPRPARSDQGPVHGRPARRRRRRTPHQRGRPRGYLRGGFFLPATAGAICIFDAETAADVTAVNKLAGLPTRSWKPSTCAPQPNNPWTGQTEAAQDEGRDEKTTHPHRAHQLSGGRHSSSPSCRPRRAAVLRPAHVWAGNAYLEHCLPHFPPLSSSRRPG